MRASGGVTGLGLRTPVRRRVTHRREVALEVHRDHGVELLFAGVGEHPVADDARVVHQDIQSTEGVDGRRNEAFGLRPVGDVGTAGDGFATGSGDFVDDALRGAATACR